MGRIYDALVRAEAERRAPPDGPPAPLDSPAPEESRFKVAPAPGAPPEQPADAPDASVLEERLAALEVVVHALDDRLEAELPSLSERLESAVVDSKESIERQLRRDRDAATLVGARSTRRLEHALFTLAAVGGIASLCLAALLIWLR